MKGIHLFSRVILLFACLVTLPASAAIVGLGDVAPDISLWDSSTEGSVGISQVGGIYVDAGSELASRLGNVGTDEFGVGAVSISGPGSSWVVTNGLTVGDKGQGQITVVDSGQLTTASAVVGNEQTGSGIVEIHGSGSEWNFNHVFSQLDVGKYGEGTIAISDGGRLISLTTYLGFYSTGVGTVIVTGAGSRWENSSKLEIAGNGSKLRVENGGEVVVGELHAALSNLEGNGTIVATKGAILDEDLRFDATHGSVQSLPFGSGGTLTFHVAEGVFGVGYQTSGTITIAEGANLTSGGGVLGYGFGSHGEAIVSGTGTSWTSDFLNVGQWGNGTLQIVDGGGVNSGVGHIGSPSLGSGIVRVVGPESLWNVSGSIDIAGFGIGELIIEGGGQVFSQLGSIALAPDSKGTVRVAGEGSAWYVAGDLGVGTAGLAEMDIVSGGIVKVGGRLSLGTGWRESSLDLATGGKLALAGEADESLTHFLSLIHDSISADLVRYWDHSTLAWALLKDATPGMDYTLEYFEEGELAGYTLLTVGKVGDFNGDGVVSGSDFLAWQRNPELGELTDWQEDYGQTFDTQAEATAVPEPAGVVFLLAAALIAGAGLRIRVLA